MTIARLLALVAVDGSHEGDELAGDNPVKISVLDLFVVLVLAYVELIIIVPVVCKRDLKSLKTVNHRALVEAVSLTGVSERLQSSLVLVELVVGLVGLHLQDHHHEGAHEEAGVG